MEQEEGKITKGDPNRDGLRLGGHLSDEEIIAYQYGKLPSPETELRAQNHLIECRRCTHLLLELNAFAEYAAASMSVKDENLDSQWAQFQKKLSGESKSVNHATPVVADVLKPQKSFFGFLSFDIARLAVLASMIILASGAIIFVILKSQTNQSQIVKQTETAAETKSAVAPSTEKNENEANQSTSVSEKTPTTENISNQNLNRKQQKTPPPLTLPNNSLKNETVRQAPRLEKEPALNTVDFELYPEEAVRGSEEADLRKIRIDQPSRLVRLKLKTPSIKNFSNFQAEITDSQNKIILARQLAPTKNGDFILNIPPNLLSTGIYSIKIYGKQSGARKLFSAYGFKLEYE